MSQNIPLRSIGKSNLMITPVGLTKSGLLTAILEIAGALGLISGIWFHAVLLISSGGLALLLFFGFLVRLKVKDGLLMSLPALFYFALNSYIFLLAGF